MVLDKLVNECRIWTGSAPGGYGTFLNKATKKSMWLSRAAIGIDDPSVEVHHLCGKPACYEPTHLLPLTHAEHVALHVKLGTKKWKLCAKGHDDWFVRHNGLRECRTCKVERTRQWRKEHG